MAEVGPTQQDCYVPPDRLRSHVSRGSHHSLGHEGCVPPALSAPAQSHQAEVSNFRLVVGVQQDVGSFYVPEWS